jgi:hypothetical protein
MWQSVLRLLKLIQVHKEGPQTLPFVILRLTQSNCLPEIGIYNRIGRHLRFAAQ